MYVVEEAQKEISQALAKATALESKEIVLERPANASFGDRAFPVFELAREKKQKPFDEAKRICEKTPAGNLFFKPTPAGGYVNFFFTPEFFKKALKQALEAGKEYGASDFLKGKKKVIEFSQPNPGKPMHLGHIRSTILGDVAARLLDFQGCKTLRMNYMNDCGSHVAELLVALKKFKDLPKVEDEKDLIAYYVKIKKAIEEDEKLKRETQDVLAALAAGEKSFVKELDKIKKLSWNAFEKNYELLGVKFDDVVWESTLVKHAKEVVEECLKKKIAFKDPETGAVVVDLEKHGLPNTILLRSNGTTLYFTTDLALADYKWEKCEFDESVYFTASEQNLHFKQLFLTLKLLNRPYADKLKHVGFGLVNLPEGKMSTRAGRVVLLEDVLTRAVEAAREEVEKRQEYSKQDAEEIARSVGVSAVKFSVLRVSPEKEIMFDFKAMTSFEGDTSAFVQYSLVRAKSILRKAKELGLQLPKPKDLNHEESNQLEFNCAERALLASIAEFPLVVRRVAESLEPHVVCDFLLKQSALFSSFYDSSPVLKAATREEQAKRLAILEAASVVFENGLRLLGIQTPAKM